MSRASSRSLDSPTDWSDEEAQSLAILEDSETATSYQSSSAPTDHENSTCSSESQSLDNSDTQQQSDSDDPDSTDNEAHLPSPIDTVVSPYLYEPEEDVEEGSSVVLPTDESSVENRVGNTNW